MVQRRVIELVDDVDGSLAARTVRFGLDNVEYEIDLSKRNEKKLAASLSPYTKAARKVKTRRTR